MKNIISIIAIMLVICMFAACTGPVDPNEETTAGNTTEATTVAPTETTEEPTTEITEAPATETTEAPATETTEAPATETTEAPATETTEAPATETTEAPATETTEAPATETTEAPATETTEAPATETTEETSEEITEERPSVDNCTHAYEQTKVELVVEGGSCVDGVKVTYECSVCGDSREDTYYDEHVVVLTAISVGDNSVCDEHIPYIKACACGMSSEFILGELSVFTYENPDDVDCDLLKVIETCSECGISATLKMDLAEIDGCSYIYTTTISIEINAEVVSTADVVLSETEHSYEDVSAELMPGASTCEDGVIVIRECTNCGDTVRTVKYVHTGIKEYVNLSELEGVCANHYIGVYTCVCGAVESIDSDTKQWSYSEGDGCYVASCSDCELTVKRYNVDADGETGYCYEFFYGEEKFFECKDTVSAQ